MNNNTAIKIKHSGFRWRGTWIALLVLFLLMLGVFQPALAKGVILQGDIPAGQVVDNDLVLMGESPSIDGNVHGDVYVVGSRITINGEIDGSLFLLGDVVQINNVVQGTVSGVALEMTLGSEAALQRNLHYIGFNLFAQPGSSIGRDLVAWCFGAQLNGSVGRDMKAVIGSLQLLNAVLELIGAPPIRLGDAIRTSAAPVWQMSGAGVLLGWTGWQAAQAAASPRDIRLDQADLQAALQAGEIDWAQVEKWLLKRFEGLIVLFVFGLLAVWLFPRRLIGTGQALEKKLLSVLGYGLLGFVLAVNLLGVVLLLAIIFLIIGLWVGTLDLWALALAFWAVAYPALALTTAILGLFVIFGTKVIVASFVGDWLLRKLAPQAAHRLLAIFIGLLIYLLLISIPMIGWVIAVAVTSLGIGAAWLDLRFRNAPATGSVVVESQLPEEPLAAQIVPEIEGQNL